MIALLQRVTQAQVRVGELTTGAIDQGLLVFLCAQPSDTLASAEKLLQRILRYRIFADAQGRMNSSVQDIAGGVLLVPQFTLAADTASGLRPGFSHAAPPALGQSLFDYAWQYLQQQHNKVGCGVFGADMQVSLINDGPATFWLQTD